MFQHNFIEPKPLEQVNTEQGRRYVTPEGRSYPSITTVLGQTKDKTGLNKWKARVGEKEAARISKMATTRGTAMHQLCEDYLLGQATSGDQSSGQDMFNTIKPALDRFDNIRALETQLYSNMLGVAGTVDCIAEIDGKLSVIDFKTASRPKKEEWVQDYFLQAAFYFTAFYEQTNEMPDQIAILIACDDSILQEFIIPKKDVLHLVERLRTRIEIFHNRIEESKLG